MSKKDIEQQIASLQKELNKLSEGPNKELENLLLEGQLVVNYEEPTEAVLLCLARGIIKEISKTAIKEIMGDKSYDKYKKSHMVYAKFDYNRTSTRPLFLDKNNIWAYNSYVPPVWQHDNFFFGKPLPEKEDVIPEVYEAFFTHLANGDRASVEYIIDWLATAMQSRNYTILCAIGEPGIGKGILGTIMEKLVGERNFVRTRDEIFKNKFNGQLRNKILVYIDEIKLKNTEDHNRVKDIVNDKIEVERKGYDAEYIINHASYYITSNQLDAVRPEPGDRRFSIIELTEEKLTKTPLINRMEEILSDTNISKLAMYLLSKKVTQDMLTPFVSRRSEEIKEASLKDWEQFVIFQWTNKNIGKEVPLKELQDKIKEEFPRMGHPGRSKIEALARQYPQFLKICRPDPSSRLIKVLDSPNKVIPLKEKLKHARQEQSIKSPLQ